MCASLHKKRWYRSEIWLVVGSNRSLSSADPLSLSCLRELHLRKGGKLSFIVISKEDTYVQFSCEHLCQAVEPRAGADES